MILHQNGYLIDNWKLCKIRCCFYFIFLVVLQELCCIFQFHGYDEEELSNMKKSLKNFEKKMVEILGANDSLVIEYQKSKEKISKRYKSTGKRRRSDSSDSSEDK